LSRNIGPYEIKRELGQGGMGTVYLARDPRLGRKVAIKVLQPKFYMDDPEFSARFEREARIIASLSHSSIVPIYEFGDDGEWRYIVMPYMIGGSLRDRLKRGVLPLEEVAQIINRIGSALDKAHSKGIYHRDVTPGNILFSEEGEAFLSDFGIVKLAEGSETYTRSGATLGTPHYMSPEQIDNKDVDGRSDLYGLGVILYEMLSWQKPFHHDSAYRLLIMHLVNPVPNILEIRPNLPPKIADVVRKAMAKNPADRYQSGAAMAAAVREALELTDVTMIPSTPIETKQPKNLSNEETEPVLNFRRNLKFWLARLGLVGLFKSDWAGIKWLAVGIMLVLLGGTGGWWLNQSLNGNNNSPTRISEAQIPLDPAGTGTQSEEVTAPTTPTGTMTLTPSPTSTSTLTATPTPTKPGKTPTTQRPPGPYVQINGIAIENGRYIVDFETLEYTPTNGGMHIHFFFNTVPPEQAGVGPNQLTWFVYYDSSPFTGYAVADRPQGATQLCALVANANHTIILETGNCVNLPEE